MTKHTKGPWTVRGPDKASIVGRRRDSDLPLHVAEVSLPIDDGHEYEMQKANAHLIAAAPELLEACRKLLAEHKEHTKMVSSPAIRTAVAAIAKAKGN